MLLRELPPLAGKVEAARSRMPVRKIATGAHLDDSDGFNFRLKKHQLTLILSKLLTQLFDLSYDIFFQAQIHFCENLSRKHAKQGSDLFIEKLSHNLSCKILILFCTLLFCRVIKLYVNLREKSYGTIDFYVTQKVLDKFGSKRALSLDIVQIRYKKKIRASSNESLGTQNCVSRRRFGF